MVEYSSGKPKAIRTQLPKASQNYILTYLDSNFTVQNSKKSIKIFSNIAIIVQRISPTIE